MRPPFVEPQPALYKRRKRDGYDSGPKRKRKRKQLAPEPIETFDDKLAHRAKAAWAWCQEHNREAMAIAGGLALVAAAIVWYFVKEAERESQSWLQLSTVTQEIDQAERLKADTRDRKKDAEEAARKFKRILRDYGDTAATPFVELEWGNTLYEKADYQGAHDAYARLVAKYGRTPAGQLGLWGQALAAEQLGKYEEAVAALQRLRKGCPQYLTMQVEFDLARCLEAAGRDAEAKPHYDAVLKLTSDDEIRAVAKSRIERIDQGRTDTAAPAKPPTRAAAPAKAKSADTATTGAAAKPVDPPGAAQAK